MKLYEAIKYVVTKRGVAIVATKQFVNVLDDIGAFKDEPSATKKVMKGLLESGFGELVYHLKKDSKPSNWQNSVRKVINDYTNKSGYKEELTNNIVAQLLYALGLIDELPKRTATVHNNISTGVSYQPHIKDPKELLYALKKEYQQALQELLTIANDEFGHKVSFYSTDAETKLYVLDAKIRLIAKEVGDSDIDSWLSVERGRVENKYKPNPAQINQALKDVLATLEREYNALMDKAYVVEDDEFGLKSARFSQDSVSDFKSIEDKILIIGKRLKQDIQPWIDKTKSDYLASKSSPASVRNGVLDQLKNDYRQRLSQLDKENKSGDLDFSDIELKKTRRKLINLGSLLGKNLEQWCNAENEKITESRNARFARRKKRNIIISAAAGIALLIGGTQTVSYTSSADARANYEVTMASANAEYAKGNYVVALDLFQKAENEYNASYSSSSYKSAAHDKAVEATDKIISNWKEQVSPLLEGNKVAYAKAMSLALPSNLVFAGNTENEYKTLSAKIDEDLERRTATIIDELLSEIYAHKGKLSPSAKEELEQMIKVVPNNYWLNFIMEKSK